MSKREAISKLRSYLAALFDVRYAGANGNSHSKAQGYADGYMQALADMRLMNERELLAVVNEERHRAGARADAGLSAPVPQATTCA